MKMGDAVPARQTQAESEAFFYGWFIVAILFVVSIIDGGFTYIFSAFLRPLSEEFGWTRAQTAGGFSLYLLAAGTILPLWGWLADRVGVRWVFLLSALIDGVALILLSYVQSLTAFYILYFFLGAGLAGIGPTTVGKVVSEWFVAKRGRALGMALVGAGGGGLVLVPLAGFLIEEFTWRLAYQMLAGLSLGVMFPLVLFFLTDTPQQKGLVSLGQGQQPEEEADGTHDMAPQQDYPWTLRTALTTPTFWLLGLTLSCGIGAAMSFNAHQVALLQDAGFSLELASSITGASLGLSMGGRFVVGWTSEYSHHPHTLLAVCLVAQMLGLSFLLFLDMLGGWVLVLVVPFFGLGFGGLVVLWPLTVGHNFGLHAFGVIAGVMGTISVSITGALGPIVLGVIYDTTGSYDWGLIVCISLFLLGAGVAKVTPSPRIPE